jgi:hypothetical protein
LEIVKAKYPALVAESAREGFITDAVWYSSGLVPVFEAARHKYMTEDLGMKVEEPAVWAKPTSRENRTLIQRDFEHLSHPKRIQERFEFFAAEQALVSQDLILIHHLIHLSFLLFLTFLCLLLLHRMTRRASRASTNEAAA